MKTYSAKPTDVTRKWHVIDASEAPLGRIASIAASLLIGKQKAQYTPHIDCGDHVIVINSDKLVTTGDKTEKKIYYRHSGYPGGIKQATLKELMEKDSTAVIQKAIRGMLPVNKLRDGRLKRLKVYADDNHQHAPQQPTSISVKDYK